MEYKGTFTLNLNPECCDLQIIQNDSTINHEGIRYLDRDLVGHEGQTMLVTKLRDGIPLLPSLPHHLGRRYADGRTAGVRLRRYRAVNNSSAGSNHERSAPLDPHVSDHRWHRHPV